MIGTMMATLDSSIVTVSIPKIMADIVVRDCQLWCGGGASLPRAVQRAAKRGLAGLEFGASIPGSVGGAVAMNAGAYRSELKDILRWAVVCTADGRRRVGPDDLEMGYRRTEPARRGGRGGGGVRPADRRPRRDPRASG